MIISFCVQACYSQECISVNSLPTVANLPSCPVGNGQPCSGNGVHTVVLLMVSIWCQYGIKWTL